jgi:hypothetical protein
MIHCLSVRWLTLRGSQLGFSSVSQSFCSVEEWATTRAYPAEEASRQKVLSSPFEENNGGMGV